MVDSNSVTFNSRIDGLQTKASKTFGAMVMK